MKHTYKLYGFVPYQLSGIQKGIQFGHAVVEYSLMYNNNEEYKNWSEENKTFIILDGGTTNNSPYNKGTLNIIRDEIHHNNIKYQTFHEPDLGDQLTAVVFLVDERVWDKEKYADLPNSYDEYTLHGTITPHYQNWKDKFTTDVEEQNKIIFLRNLLKGKKLA
jgi:hypothetical protein